MESTTMKLKARQLVMLMCLAFWTCESDMELNIRIDSKKYYVFFNNEVNSRFTECLCCKSVIKCKADLSCTSYWCAVTDIPSANHNDVTSLKNRYNCLMKLDRTHILCERRLNQSDKYNITRFHIKNPEIFQLQCVDISWYYRQFIEVSYPDYSKFSSGNAPASCFLHSNATATTLSTTKWTTESTTSTIKHTAKSTISTTAPTTTTTPRLTAAYATTKQRNLVISTSPKDSYSTELKTGLYNSSNGGAGDKVHIIVEVIISLFTLLAVGVGLLFLRRRRRKHREQTRRKSQNGSLTVSAENKSDNVMNNEMSFYSNVTFDKQEHITDAMEDYKTDISEIMDEYTVANSKQSVIHSPGPQVSDPHMYLNNRQVEYIGETTHNLINNNVGVTDPTYSFIDQNRKESHYSNTKSLCVDISKSDQMETYLNVSKKQNPFMDDNGSTVIKVSRPIYNELETTSDYTNSEVRAVGESDPTPDKTPVSNVYCKLGDRSRHFNNPYNALSGTVDSAKVSHFDAPSVTEVSNLLTEYSLASSSL